MMLVYAIAELFVEEAKAGKHEKIRSVLSKITDSKAWSVFRKYIGPMAVLALTVLVVCLNFSMMSDRVLWGDEAFSGALRDRNRTGTDRCAETFRAASGNIFCDDLRSGTGMSGVQSGSPHVCAGFPVCNGLLLLFLQSHC